LSYAFARCSALVMLLLGAAGCGDSTQPAGPVAVQGVIVTPQVIHFASVGDTARALAVISPTNATDQAVTWESTDSSVATVDSLGLVTATGHGLGVFVTVVTHDGHHEASVNVGVDP
jgi:uncharacterized protein YjdB